MALGDNTAALQEILERTKKLPDVSAAVLYTPQELTAEQQAQARSNIGALAESELDAAVDGALAQAKASGEFKGEKGETGAQGPQGPAYALTEADKAEMVAAVIAALPVYNGEVVPV